MTRAELVLETWKRLYVIGVWSLAQLEEHLEAMLPVIPLEWW